MVNFQSEAEIGVIAARSNLYISCICPQKEAGMEREIEG